jgi:hypothetical protein
MLQVGTITLSETIGGSSCQIDETAKFPLYIPFYCCRNLLQCTGMHVGFASEVIHAMATSLVGLGLVRRPSWVDDFRNMPRLPLLPLPSLSINHILLKGKTGEAVHGYKVQVLCTLLHREIFLHFALHVSVERFKYSSIVHPNTLRYVLWSLWAVVLVFFRGFFVDNPNGFSTGPQFSIAISDVHRLLSHRRHSANASVRPLQLTTWPESTPSPPPRC